MKSANHQITARRQGPATTRPPRPVRGGISRSILGGLVLAGAGPLSAAEFELEWAVLVPAVETSQGGDFELTATLGETADSRLAGGDFALSGGFWSLVNLGKSPEAPGLSAHLEAGSLVLTWPVAGTDGFRIEEARDLTFPLNWMPLSDTPQTSQGVRFLRLPLQPGNRFYRLSLP